MNRSLYCVAILLLFSSSAFGQTSGTFQQTVSGGLVTITGTFHVPAVPARVVTGAPFSGEAIEEVVQQLPRGSHSSRQNTGIGLRTFRDSKGRVRAEDAAMRSYSQPGDAGIAEITDPVAGYYYLLDNVNRVVHRAKLGLRVTASDGTGGVVPAVEKLGSKSIDGVTVEGTRTTVTVPAGVQTSEVWYSKELDLNLMTVNLLPENTRVIHTLANFTRAEPDPQLFTIPAGYKVIDERSGTFTISWGGQ